jgi:hypothetical protein
VTVARVTEEEVTVVIVHDQAELCHSLSQPTTDIHHACAMAYRMQWV